MKNFIQEEYIPSNITLYMAEQAGWDMGTPASVFVEHEAAPAGGLIVHKGAKVFATDGHAGKVDDFLVEKKNRTYYPYYTVRRTFMGEKGYLYPC